MKTDEKSNENTAIPAQRKSIEKSHGRIVTRRVTSTGEVSWLQSRRDWAQLSALIMVNRRCVRGDTVSTETQYYISSLTATSKVFEGLIRGHWSIENQLHWMLDVTFREDDSPIHTDCAPENFSLLRKIAMAYLKNDASLSAGVRRKRLIAGWDDDFAFSQLIDGSERSL